MTTEQISARIAELQIRASEIQDELLLHRQSQDKLFQQLAENNAIIEEKEAQILEINKKLKE